MSQLMVSPFHHKNGMSKVSDHWVGLVRVVRVVRVVWVVWVGWVLGLVRVGRPLVGSGPPVLVLSVIKWLWERPSCLYRREARSHSHGTKFAHQAQRLDHIVTRHGPRIKTRANLIS